MILLANGINYVNVYVNGQRLKFLIDTGASVCAIKKSSVPKNININAENKIKVKGVSGSTIAIGTICLNFCLCKEFFQEFLVLKSFSREFDGILGGNFFNRYNAIINYEKSTLILTKNGEKINVLLFANGSQRHIIPPRCEKIIYCKVNDQSDYVVTNEELCDGVYTASTIVRSHEKKIPVKVLNLRNESVCIKNFVPKLSKLEDYNIIEFEENAVSPKRVAQLIKELSLEHLNSEEKDAIHRICCKYSDVFHLPEDKLTYTNVYKQSIQLQNNVTPVYVKPYRLPYSQKCEINSQIEKMLSDDIIEPTRCEWSSPLIVVPKKTGADGKKKWRVVIDYRLLNKKIQDDKFPLPCISEILDSLSGATYFTHLDLSQGYYQVELTPDSRPCTAFVTDQGQFQMKRLPMGLKISPSAFSRLMTVAMSGLTYEKCFVYLDDIIVFGKNLNEHNKNLIAVLERLRHVNLKLNPSKCDFLKKEILYLGHSISEKGILPDKDKIITMQNYPVPCNATEVKRFTAFANYYRKYVPHFAEIAAPLNRLTKKGAEFIWSKECQNSFLHLKNSLIQPPILQYPDFSPENEFILRTDASGIALGAILSNGDDKPVAYASRTLNKAEKNYPVIEKELLAVVWAVKHFRPYLFGRHFKILTDHRPLVYLFNMTNPSSRLTKFRLILEEYDFKIIYVKGKENATADALSRIEIESADLMVLTRAQQKAIDKNKLDKSIESKETDLNSNEDFDDLRIVQIVKRPKSSVELKISNKLNIAKLSKNEVYTTPSKSFSYIPSKYVIYMKKDSRSTSTPEVLLREIQYVCKQFKIKELVIQNEDDEILFLLKQLRQLVNWTGPKFCIVSSAKFIGDDLTRKLILNDYHTLPTGGHAGMTRMYNNVRRSYYWPGLKDDIQKFISKCSDCARYKYSIDTRQPLTITTTSSSAFDKLYLDLVGPLPKDINGNSYILTLQCELSKYVEAYPLSDKESVTVAKSFVNNFILRYGIPREIVTDRGTEFISKTMKAVCDLLKISKLTSTAYHHETLGSLENSHKSLGSFLRIQSKEHPNEWSEWIPFWNFAYNNTVHSETGYMPVELVFGKKFQIPSNTSLKTDPLYNFEDYPRELKFRLQWATKEARERLIKSKENRKHVYDKKSRELQYSPGDLIMIRNPVGNKLSNIYEGPYEVIEEKEPNVLIKNQNKTDLVHKNRTKLFKKA